MVGSPGADARLLSGRTCATLTCRSTRCPAGDERHVNLARSFDSNAVAGLRWHHFGSAVDRVDRAADVGDGFGQAGADGARVWQRCRGGWAVEGRCGGQSLEGNEGHQGGEWRGGQMVYGAGGGGSSV